MKKTQPTIILGTVLAMTMMNTSDLHAGSPVRIAAEVTRPENNVNPVTITVTNHDGDTIWTRTSRADHFVLRLPDNEPYIISFEQLHCLRKEVTIDGTRASRSITKARVRKVAFEVVLGTDPNFDLRYAGPVGRIDFQPGTGRLLVERDYAMVKVNR